MSATVNRLPSAFIWRRLHSLTGLWLVLFLMEHLLVNSQAALLLGDNGKGFVEMVNSIHNLPYLQVIELFLLGVPILIHAIWGIKYALTSKANSFGSDGSKPSIVTGRNRAYSWQRITSWILLFLLAFHIVKFRFVEYPNSVNLGPKTLYFSTISTDDGIYSVAERVGATLYTENEIKDKQELFGSRELKPGEVVAASDNFGTISLLLVRDTFKSPFYVGLYTVFVLAACFHAFNGFWTFLISWGWILKMSSQKSMVKVALVLMLIIGFLGLAAVWGTYWLNLKY